MRARNRRALVTDIHHFALDDGPGIRTTVFLKGCPLSCIWCHNPECIDSRQEMAFHASLCIGCGDCLHACPHNAIRMDTDARIDKDSCTTCGLCAEACPSTALRVTGIHYSVSELTEILLKDRLFHTASEGGVTFSGGEPTFHMDYVSEVARELKNAGIHLAIQTAGYFNLKTFTKKLLPYLDLIYFDIKLLDPLAHKHWTGKDNKVILENLTQLMGTSGVTIIPRVPLIPDITATQSNLVGIAAFLRERGCKAYELLPFNSGGILKREEHAKAVSEALSQTRYTSDAEERYRQVFAHAFLQNPVSPI